MVKYEGEKKAHEYPLETHDIKLRSILREIFTAYQTLQRYAYTGERGIVSSPPNKQAQSRFLDRDLYSTGSFLIRVSNPRINESPPGRWNRVTRVTPQCS